MAGEEVRGGVVPPKEHDGAPAHLLRDPLGKEHIARMDQDGIWSVWGVPYCLLPIQAARAGWSYVAPLCPPAAEQDAEGVLREALEKVWSDCYDAAAAADPKNPYANERSKQNLDWDNGAETMQFAIYDGINAVFAALQARFSSDGEGVLGDALKVEGRAAQLHYSEHLAKGGIPIRWDSLRADVKDAFRRIARDESLARSALAGAGEREGAK